MKRNSVRILSLLLAMIMVVTLFVNLAAAAHADDEEPAEEIPVAIEKENETLEDDDDPVPGGDAGGGYKVVFDASNADETDASGNPVYWYDGNVHSPIITVTYNGEEVPQGYDTWRPWYNYMEDFGEMDATPNKRGKYNVHIFGIDELDNEYFDFVISDIWTYVVLFNKNDGSGVYDSSGTITWGTTIPEANIPEFTRENYDFAGWYTDPECTDGNEFDVTQAIKGQGFSGGVLNVYAKWIEKTAPQPDPDEPITPAPNTGDAMYLWVALASVSSLGAAWVYRKKD